LGFWGGAALRWAAQARQYQPYYAFNAQRIDLVSHRCQALRA
jgi:hypothetical protein